MKTTTRIIKLYDSIVEELKEEGLVEIHDKYVILTEKGRRIAEKIKDLEAIMRRIRFLRGNQQ